MYKPAQPKQINTAAPTDFQGSNIVTPHLARTEALFGKAPRHDLAHAEANMMDHPTTKISNSADLHTRASEVAPVIQQRAAMPLRDSVGQVGTTYERHAATDGVVQRKVAAATQPRPTPIAPRNNTGLPDRLKTGIESLSGISMDHVKVHYNSSKPAQLKAHAYTHANQIYLGPGQKQHLPHEAWHIVQQARGRVKPTLRIKGVAVNDNEGLEKEADAMGQRAMSALNPVTAQALQKRRASYVTNNAFAPNDQMTLPQDPSATTSLPVQLKSHVYAQQDQTYYYGAGYYGAGSINVGKFVAVGLDPNDMPTGQSANLNTSQDRMMDAIRTVWGIQGGNLVKGHLWNDNLGGSAMNYNLYPITRAANSDHLHYVENVAKTCIWENHQPIYYQVTVDAIPQINQPKADFNCQIYKWDPNTGQIGDRLIAATIKSDLRNVAAYDEAYETHTGYKLNKQKNPKKPAWANNPKTTVSELTPQEKWDRANQ